MKRQYMVYRKRLDGSVEEFGRREDIDHAVATIKAMTRFVGKRGDDTLYYYCLPIPKEEI